MNAEVNYINRIVDTTLFFFETMEEGNGGGSTQIINLIKPDSRVNNVALRDFVLNDCFRLKGRKLTDAAVDLSRWLRVRNLAPIPIDDEDLKVRIACSSYQRELLNTQDLHPDRAYHRLARHIWRMQNPDVGRHSRVFEFFISAQVIQRGRSLEAPVKGFHPEHVVPCAEILRICLKVLSEMKGDSDFAPEETSIAKLVPLIKRLLGIVQISENERKRLDIGSKALKDRMPENWDDERGCIFQRLHDAEIAFELLPNGLMNCQCQFTTINGCLSG